MNYLAHIYLSGNNELVTIGNFIADGIRGKNYKSYHKDIQTGILLHRNIDTYTDAHKTVRQSTKRLHKNYSHYSGVIVDILYDHFLAKNWNKYSDESLTSFVYGFYQSMEENFDILTPKTQRILPVMIENNWLESYASVEGISKILYQMDYRTKFKSKMQFAVEELEMFYSDFENEFTLFFEELRNHVKEKLVELNEL